MLIVGGGSSSRVEQGSCICLLLVCPRAGTMYYTEGWLSIIIQRAGTVLLYRGLAQYYNPKGWHSITIPRAGTALLYRGLAQYYNPKGWHYVLY